MAKQITDKLNEIAKAIDPSIELPSTNLITDSLDAITKAYGGTPTESNLIVDKLDDIADVATGGSGEGIIPSGRRILIKNANEYNVAQYASAFVDVIDLRHVSVTNSTPNVIYVRYAPFKYSRNMDYKDSYARGTFSVGVGGTVFADVPVVDVTPEGFTDPVFVMRIEGTTILPEGKVWAVTGNNCKVDVFENRNVGGERPYIAVYVAKRLNREIVPNVEISIVDAEPVQVTSSNLREFTITRINASQSWINYVQIYNCLSIDEDDNVVWGTATLPFNNTTVVKFPVTHDGSFGKYWVRYFLQSTTGGISEFENDPLVTKVTSSAGKSYFVGYDASVTSQTITYSL